MHLQNFQRRRCRHTNLRLKSYTFLTGLRPFKLPHTRGDPLVNPPEGLCGAGDSATHDYDNLVDYLSRDKGRSGLYFSPYYKIQFCSIQPKPQIWAKAQVVKRRSRGINSPISCSELSPRNTESAGPSGSHEGPPSCRRGCKGEGNALPFDYEILMRNRTSRC